MQATAMGEEPLQQLPRAYGPPAGCADMRARALDFQVEELLGFQPSGAGEHLFLQVRKTGMSTDAAAGALARALDVRPRDVGYAGLKDRHAVTTQWFSVQGAPEPPPGPLPDEPAVEVIGITRNARKLRRGALTGNRFTLRLVNVQGGRPAIESRLSRLALEGAPNYFGAQRFGIGGGNLARARDLLGGRSRVRSRHRRGLYLSAARSHLFNQVLAHRIEQGNWRAALPGELVMLDGSHSVFPEAREEGTVLLDRLAAMDLHPTGPLPGRGGTNPTGAAQAAEQTALAGEASLVEALAGFGVASMRRALRMRVSRLHWHWSSADVLEVGFDLAAGCYATVALREALALTDCGGVDADAA